MDELRRVLQRLGWPVESLSDEEIVGHLTDKWYAGPGRRREGARPVGLAAAIGILASMANDGNLDALCWPAENAARAPDDLGAGELGALGAPRQRRGPSGEAPRLDRRRSRRASARDVLDFVNLDSSETSTGFLVDVSAAGVAFIAENKDVPPVGSRIAPTIHRQTGESTELGWATVVRTELLSDFLSLVCAELKGT